ncbi:stage II sporulation protein M [Paenibacillus apiarius]|uniref:Stage II sporulation protein M n=1 Tax=Paenibacillus apiarius TaxID=46240 RepID=A0ABT4DTG4_9BACL|nr:stage II sporulation protein M [Paenibacillus apiarius]MBN3523706.1 stage II sporulation protein M [Paenibacillus apiarius]MCY9516310.1 stage II sporulation protein M [Paenibacillus apiarius]MCY9520637.1 stage II sporulation protein M [Paenibacillus apiarius]MCY9552492.1 stage II sporulation protein M [Paenibacillus apiarius]MCY9561034.1 stage II sporulation protein M [Paenibacillus apiarius]
MLSLASWWNTLKELRWYLLASIVLFAAGYVLGNNWSGLEQFVLQQLQGLEGARNQLMQSENQELSFFVFIFYNNAIKAVLIMFAGIAFGLIPAGFLLVNGMVIGFLLRVMESTGVNVGEVIIKGLLPHGILEIPAILIAGAYGLKFGVLLLRRLFGKRERRSAARLGEWAKRTGAGAVWVTLLLLIAAVIESTVTLWLMK